MLVAAITAVIGSALMKLPESFTNFVIVNSQWLIEVCL